MKTRLLLFAALLPLSCTAQSEAELRSYFEGKRVTVKIEMPATKYGIDLTYGSPNPIDFKEYSRRVKEHGVALRAGESVLVTGVKVKEKLIEFQLAGGGYGTLGDDTSTYVYVPSASKSRREKELEKNLKNETDPRLRRRMESELGDLRSDRHREDRIAQAAAAQASDTKKAALRERALDAGSRFNIRVPNGFFAENPPTPELVKNALQSYVEFER